MVNEIRERLIEFGAIEFGDFTLASGAKSSYYVDVKTAATNPVLLQAIGKEIAAKFSFDVVAGVAVGAVPLAVAVSLASKKPYAIIRQSAKDYGKSGAIIGDVRNRQVLLVEDVTTSGGSVVYGIDCLRSAGAVVDTVVAVVDREQGAPEALARSGVNLCPLVKASDILKR
jgi:orotate phosphoribosyltransferase